MATTVVPRDLTPSHYESLAESGTSSSAQVRANGHYQLDADLDGADGLPATWGLACSRRTADRSAWKLGKLAVHVDLRPDKEAQWAAVAP